MSKIYTKTGDRGTTGLYGGKRINKGELRLEAYGTVDELNSALGVLANYPVKYLENKFIIKIQADLFVIGSHLAADPQKDLKLPELRETDIELLENKIDELTDLLPELKTFVLPGGNKPSGFAHLARTICRRAERCIVRLESESSVNPLILIFMNRLSDLLFVMARYYVIQDNKTEIPWIPSK